MTEIAELNLDNGPGIPEAFSAWDSKPPPAPKLHSNGIIAMDITEQFKNAAESKDVSQDFDITC
jgi:hypothetical protein